MCMTALYFYVVIYNVVNQAVPCNTDLCSRTYHIIEALTIQYSFVLNCARRLNIFRANNNVCVPTTIF